MKTIVLFFSFFACISASCLVPISVSAVTQQDLQVSGGDQSVAGTDVTVKENFMKTIQSYMIGLLGIVSVSVFIYIGYNLFTAQGKEEDFKNAWKALVYAIVGLAIIPLAYVVVRIATGFSL